MRLSFEWLGDYVRLPADLTHRQIAHDLTMSTVEVEGLVDMAEGLRDVVVGEITAAEPHPSRERLYVVHCDVGTGQPAILVSAADTLRPGARVAVALPGAKIVRAEGEEGFAQVEARSIGGVGSAGMLCTPENLGLDGLFPAGELIDLAQVECGTGDALAGAIGFDDVVLEIDNKSLTNRPDLWGHYGIARELAAIYDLELRDLPAAHLAGHAEGPPVEIREPSRCRRYTATRITGVQAVDSPLWLRSRLLRVGQRPLNLLVDLTNYVMLAVGQPSHASDAGELCGGIQVRTAAPGEEVVLLDGTTVRPEAEYARTLLVADDAGPLALAGIMGADRGSIEAGTREMVLEAANFDPIGVRRTAAALGKRTESSVRFEKGLHPSLIDIAVALYLRLLGEIQPAARVVSHTDVFPQPLPTVSIQLPVSFIERKLGTPVGEAGIRRILERLGFRVGVRDGMLDVGVPWWRSTGDVSIPEDVVEEVARLYGYENLQWIPPRIDLTRAIRQPRPQLERRLKEYLALRGGMSEVITYPWVDDTWLEAAGMEDVPALLLHAPPAPTQQKLQPSLIPPLLMAVSGNVRHFSEFRVFELARTYRPDRVPTEYEPAERLPVQPKRLAAAMVGDDAARLFYEAKGILEALPRHVHVAPLTLSECEDAGWAEARGQLGVYAGSERVGVLGVLSPRAKQSARIRGAEVVLFELDVDRLMPLASRTNQFVSLPSYPLVEYDLSILLRSDVPWKRVGPLLEGAHELVRAVQLVEEYRGPPVPEGSKSLTVRLQFGSDSGTLTSTEIGAAAEAASQALATELGAEIRARSP